MNQLFQHAPLDNGKLADLLNILNANTTTNETTSSHHHQVYTNLIKSLLSLITTIYMPLVQQQQQSNPPTPPPPPPQSQPQLSLKSKNHHHHHHHHPYQNNSTKSKLVRGQDEWVNGSGRSNGNSANNFLSQVLKCMECSASFESLADLSAHMVNSQHYSKFFEQPITKSSSSSFPLAQQVLAPSASLSHHLKSKQPKASSSGSATSASSSSSGFPQKCEICSKSVTNTHLPPLVELIQHLKNEHDITNVCTNCGAFFLNHADLKSHLVEEQHYHHHHHHHNYSMNNSKNNNQQQANSKRLKFSTTTNQHIQMQQTNNKLPTSQLYTQPQLKYTANSLSANTHSPPNSSNCSSSTSATNSPPPPTLPLTSSSIDSFSSSSKSNHHPLLALQMFVNGTSDITSTQLTVNRSNEESKKIKLPAKKRPYKDEDLDDESSFSPSSSSEEFDDGKQLERGDESQMFRNTKQIKLEIKSESDEEKETKQVEEEEEENVELQKNLQHDIKPFQQKQQPLHLLQRMQLNLDNYLLS